ncbi:MAG: hypothetical protein M1827_007432 [Pycnora praestabilis]|nr:MAG: hypothetical protein M1827_007432 [Pycnora praestabilis]
MSSHRLLEDRISENSYRPLSTQIRGNRDGAMYDDRRSRSDSRDRYPQNPSAPRRHTPPQGNRLLGATYPGCLREDLWVTRTAAMSENGIEDETAICNESTMTVIAVDIPHHPERVGVAIEIEIEKATAPHATAAVAEVEAPIIEGIDHLTMVDHRAER